MENSRKTSRTNSKKKNLARYLVPTEAKVKKSYEKYIVNTETKKKQKKIRQIFHRFKKQTKRKTKNSRLISRLCRKKKS